MQLVHNISLTTHQINYCWDNVLLQLTESRIHQDLVECLISVACSLYSVYSCTVFANKLKELQAQPVLLLEMMKIFLRRGLEGPWISAHWSVHGFRQKTSTRCDINNPTLYSGMPFSLKSKLGNPSSNTRMIHYMACLHTLLSFKVTRLFYLSHQMVRFLIIYFYSSHKFSRLFALQLDSVSSFIMCLFVCTGIMRDFISCLLQYA